MYSLEVLKIPLIAVKSGELDGSGVLFLWRYPILVKMKHQLSCLALCLLMLSSCLKAVDSLNVSKTASSNSDPNSDFTLYTIPKGQHFATSNFFQSVDTDALQFMVRFDSSAIYQSIAVENQHDINKLYGFSDNGAAHHQFSARFGWSWTDGQLWLYAYVYNNGERTDVKLCAIPMNQQIRCAILAKEGLYEFWIDGEKKSVVPRKATTFTARGYLVYPYFGGDETAPHDVHIWIRNL